MSNVRSASGVRRGWPGLVGPFVRAGMLRCPQPVLGGPPSGRRQAAVILASYVAGPGGCSEPRAPCMLGNTGQCWALGVRWCSQIVEWGGAGRGGAIIAPFLSHHSHLQCSRSLSAGVCENGLRGNKRCLAVRGAARGCAGWPAGWRQTSGGRAGRPTL